MLCLLAWDQMQICADLYRSDFISAPEVQSSHHKFWSCKATHKQEKMKQDPDLTEMAREALYKILSWQMCCARVAQI